MKRRVTPLLVRNRVVCTIKARDANIGRMTTGARSYCLAQKSTNATNLDRFRAPALSGARDLASTVAANSVEPRGIGKFYHIEASNAERADATVLTVRGPDVDGILASMTVALAVKGCSLVKLHAALAGDVSSPLKEGDDDNGDKQVKDVFYVVDRATGKPFRDDELEELAAALLEATQVPMNVLSIKGAVDELEKLEAHQQQQQYPLPEEQITIVPSRPDPKRP